MWICFHLTNLIGFKVYPCLSIYVCLVILVDTNRKTFRKTHKTKTIEKSKSSGYVWFWPYCNCRSRAYGLLCCFNVGWPFSFRFLNNFFSPENTTQKQLQNETTNVCFCKEKIIILEHREDYRDRLQRRQNNVKDENNIYGQFTDVASRSINLALSHRGICALEKVKSQLCIFLLFCVFFFFLWFINCEIAKVQKKTKQPTHTVRVI